MATQVGDSYAVASGGVIAGGRYYLPGWLPPLGGIADVSLNTLESVRDSDDLSQTRAIMSAWSGCAFIAEWGVAGSLIFTGGGHDDGKLNAIYRYDIAGREFSKIKPSAPWFEGPSSRIADPLTGWMWSETSGTSVQVGEPFAAHFYAGLVGVPPSAVSGVSHGLLVTAGRTTMPRDAGAATKQAHKIRLGQDDKWTTHGSPLAVDTGYGGACYDAIRNRVVSFAGMNRTSFIALDVATGASSSISYTKAVGYPELDNYYRAAFHDTANDLYMTVRVDSPYGFSLINPVSGLITTPTVSGTAPTGSGGWEWVQEWGALVFYPGTGNKVWILSRPVNPLTGTWTYTEQTLSGSGRSQAGGNPHYNRLRYSSRYRTFFWASAANAPVQAFRIQQP